MFNAITLLGFWFGSKILIISEVTKVEQFDLKGYSRMIHWLKTTQFLPLLGSMTESFFDEQSRNPFNNFIWKISFSSCFWYFWMLVSRSRAPFWFYCRSSRRYLWRYCKNTEVMLSWSELVSWLFQLMFYDMFLLISRFEGLTINSYDSISLL